MGVVSTRKSKLTIGAVLLLCDVLDASPSATTTSTWLAGVPGGQASASSYPLLVARLARVTFTAVPEDDVDKEEEGEGTGGCCVMLRQRGTAQWACGMLGCNRLSTTLLLPLLPPPAACSSRRRCLQKPAPTQASPVLPTCSKCSKEGGRDKEEEEEGWERGILLCMCAGLVVVAVDSYSLWIPTPPLGIVLPMPLVVAAAAAVIVIIDIRSSSTSTDTDTRGAMDGLASMGQWRYVLDM